MSKWLTVKRLFYINFAVYLLALVLFILATSLPYWLVRGNDYRWGVFENCTRQTDSNGTLTDDWQCHFVSLNDNPPRFKVIIFLLYCALVAGIFTGITMLARYLPLCCVCEIYAGFFILTSTYNFTSEIAPGEELDWAFFIETASGVIYFFNGFGLIMLIKAHGRKLDRSPCKEENSKEHDAFYKIYLSRVDKDDLPNEIEA